MLRVILVSYGMNSKRLIPLKYFCIYDNTTFIMQVNNHTIIWSISAQYFEQYKLRLCWTWLINSKFLKVAVFVIINIILTYSVVRFVSTSNSDLSNISRAIILLLNVKRKCYLQKSSIFCQATSSLIHCSILISVHMLRCTTFLIRQHIFRH